MSEDHRLHKPEWKPEFDWGGVASLATFVSVVLGGLGLLWVASATWASFEKDLTALKSDQIALKSDQIALKSDLAEQRREVQAEIQRVQEGTERRLDRIHTDVQAIKNLLISGRRGDE